MVKLVYNINNPSWGNEKVDLKPGGLCVGLWFVSGGHKRCWDNPEIRFMEGGIMEVEV